MNSSKLIMALSLVAGTAAAPLFAATFEFSCDRTLDMLLTHNSCEKLEQPIEIPCKLLESLGE